MIPTIEAPRRLLCKPTVRGAWEPVTAFMDAAQFTAFAKAYHVVHGQLYKIEYSDQTPACIFLGAPGGDLVILEPRPPFFYWVRVGLC